MTYNPRVFRMFVIAGLLLFAVLVPLVALPSASPELAPPQVVATLASTFAANPSTCAFGALPLLRAPPSC